MPISPNLEQTIPEPISVADLTIVVAAVESSGSIERCLDAIDQDRAGRAVTVIVVTPGDDPIVGRAVAGRRATRLIAVEPDALTPRLWAEGIAQSSSRAIALLTGHCFVVRGWISSLLEALSTSAAAGGPLRLAEDASTLDAAIFFLRYSAYLDEAHSGPVRDIAGDNAAYVRERIPPGSWSRQAGFWERDVNRVLAERGEQIMWAREAIVEFGRTFSFTSICRHRYQHARLFGIARVERGENRLRIVVASPVVPFVLAFRAWQRISLIPRYSKRFVRSIPLMFFISCCWALGEAVGALEAGNAHRR